MCNTNNITPVEQIVVALWICTPLSLPQLQLWVTFPICWRAKREKGGGRKNYNAVCLPVCPLMWIIQNCNNITTATCCCTQTRPCVSVVTARTQPNKFWEAATEAIYVAAIQWWCHIYIIYHTNSVCAYPPCHAADRGVKVLNKWLWLKNNTGDCGSNVSV